VKPHSLARWLTAVGVTAVLTVTPASAAGIHVMISAGFHGVYSELAPVRSSAPAATIW
jgi:molybdate transport system substrate-binding protein